MLLWSLYFEYASFAGKLLLSIIYPGLNQNKPLCGLSNPRLKPVIQ